MRLSPARNEFLFVTLCGGFLILLLTGIVLVLGSTILYPKWSDLVRILGSAETGFAIRLSLLTSFLTTILALILGIPAAYYLSRYDFPGKIIVDTILDLPIVLPPPVAGLSLLIFFQTTLGNLIEGMAGDFAYQPRGIILAQFFVAAPFGVRAVKAAFDSTSSRLETVARTLGASKFKAFLKVTLPLAKNGIIAGAIITWARAFAEFGPILFFCGATRLKTEVMPIAMFLHFSIGEIEEALTIAIAMLAISLVTLIVFRRLGGKGYLW
jgi:molybdate transport system permease protein